MTRTTPTRSSRASAAGAALASWVGACDIDRARCGPGCGCRMVERSSRHRTASPDPARTDGCDTGPRRGNPRGPSNLLVWLALVAPLLWMLAPLASDPVPWRIAIRPTGYAAVVLLVAALAIEPLFRLVPASRLLFALRRRRRAVGLAASAYALVHVVVFAASIGRLDHILQGMAFASMWTGWLAFALLVPVAAISSDAAMRRLGPWWKRLQRLVHPPPRWSSRTGSCCRAVRPRRSPGSLRLPFSRPCAYSGRDPKTERSGRTPREGRLVREDGAAREVLTVGEMPTPEPGNGEVRVRLHASGVNPSDVKSRAGRPLIAPRIVPHSDGAGIIDAVGAASTLPASASASGPGTASGSARSGPPPSISSSPTRRQSACPTGSASRKAPASASRCSPRSRP